MALSPFLLLLNLSHSIELFLVKEGWSGAFATWLGQPGSGSKRPDPVGDLLIALL